MDGKPKILVVEDNPHMLKAQCRILSAAGCEVLEASEGEAGVEIALEHRPDLVLMDVMLPGIDGLEACRRIKTSNPGIFVVLLSALKTAPGEQADGLDVGADGYIARPVSNREFLARVRAMLRIRKAEAELRKSERRYRSIIQNAGVGVVVIEKDGTISTANPSFCDMTGFDPAELAGLDPPCPFLAGNYSETEWKFPDGSTGRAKLELETRIEKKDGGSFPAAVTAGPVLDESGEPELYIGFIRDITDEKRAEEALLRIKKLESLSSIVGGMAHDLNNLLGIVVGNLELFQMANPSVEDKDGNLSTAKEACMITKDLIARYIDFAKGRNVEKQTGDLMRTVEKAVKTVSGRRRTVFELSVSETLRPVAFDAAQIGKAIEEIVANAADAMEGAGVVRIRVENETTSGNFRGKILPDGNYVKITVEDTGPGIPEEHVPRIFDPYFSTKKRGSNKGMGFGLAMVHAIVTSHAGAVTVSSKPGKGAKFTVLLPACDRD